MKALEPIARGELAESSMSVAPTLLGGLVVAGRGNGRVVARLVEVEAYDGANDPASHAYRGRTARNAVMFGPAGHLYVYFTYGMHHCMNIVCGTDGVASAVLLRAATIVAGFDEVRQRRAGVAERDWARGPSRLCKALGVDRSLDGIDLCDPGSPLWLAAGSPVAASRIASGPRVGIGQAVDRPWRYWIDGEPAVSAYKSGGNRARRRTAPAGQTRIANDR